MSDKRQHKTITVLGSTGSVGRQVLAAVDKYPDRFKIVGLSAFTNEKLLREQIDKYCPAHYYYPAGGVEIQTSLFDYLDDEKFSSKCVGSLEELAEFPCDITVSAVSGIAGLWAAVAVLQRGGTLAIANKETVVCAGRHLKALEKKYGGRILPLDSEHSAILACLNGEEKKSVNRIVLTASGGALRDVPVEKLYKVTARDALNHPVWNMGKKVTIDSATLFNKGLEVIEAMHLFSVDAKAVKVLMHRESIIHGMVELTDGSVKALLSTPDMALAIESALFWPNKAKNSVPELDLAKIGELNFSAPDYGRYPCLAVAEHAAAAGEGARIAVSAADEVMVEAFLAGSAKFNDIPNVLEKVCAKFGKIGEVALEDVFGIDAEARKYTYSVGVK